MKIKKQLIRASASISCFALGRTVSRFLFYSAIYLLDLPPGKERAALLSLRTLRYTWSFWSWCRHHYMSPYNVVSSCLAVSPLPFGGLFSVTAFIRLLPSVLSTAGCPCQSGLSSEAPKETLQRQIVLPILFLITELALHFVVLGVDLLHSLDKTWSDILTTLVALH